MSPSYILGIDLGTTSVKACLVNQATGMVEKSDFKDTLASVMSPVPGGHEQDALRIMVAAQSVVSRLPREMLRRVTRIGVSGQMHGILFWKENLASFCGKVERFELEAGALSHVYTWLDKRCLP